MSDHIPDAKKMVELSRALTRAGVDTPVFRAIDGYWYDDDEGRNGVTLERVERELCYATIVWLMGRGWSLSPIKIRKYGVWQEERCFIGRDTLAEALLAAVQREAAFDTAHTELDDQFGGAMRRLAEEADND
jgi:hypothetical protein